MDSSMDHSKTPGVDSRCDSDSPSSTRSDDDKQFAVRMVEYNAAIKKYAYVKVAEGGPAADAVFRMIYSSEIVEIADQLNWVGVYARCQTRRTKCNSECMHVSFYNNTCTR